jgi:Fe-S-cluster containining protein
MPEKDKIFLTARQALEAIRIDFRQYAPQMDLFCDLTPMILGANTVAVRDERQGGGWVRTSRRGAMRRMDGRNLGDYLYNRLADSKPSLKHLAEILRRVFQAATHIDKGAEVGRSGIWVETDMEDFTCIQCGRCCERLEYHNELTGADYERWQRLGRTEIMDRVGIITRGDRIMGYRIWVEPGTGRLSEGCPWLQEVPGGNRFECRIHDVKPGICRQYPGSRKHALMTGCVGFPGKLMPF